MREETQHMVQKIFASKSRLPGHDLTFEISFLNPPVVPLSELKILQICLVNCLLEIFHALPMKTLVSHCFRALSKSIEIPHRDYHKAAGLFAAYASPYDHLSLTYKPHKIDTEGRYN